MRLRGRQLTARKLIGFDRSGPPPRATWRGEPLNPWTIPNAIGFARIAVIPPALVIGLRSDDGRSRSANVLFAIAGFSDYLDGFAARATGQYSRLGALLDPLTDRLLIMSGAALMWRFELLPRRALAALAAREALTLALSQVALRRGRDIRVNQVGRFAVFPTMFSLFLAATRETPLAPVLLYVGVGMTWTATAIYVRDGLAAARPSTSA